MMESYMHFHRILLMILLQGWFPGCYSEDCTMILPKSIKALSELCVEIPCTFNHHRGNGNSKLVWCKESRLRSGNKIFSQQNLSDVNKSYRGRTSFVGNESNSCSLRINDVKENGTYYPSIHGNCHVSDASDCQTVKVQVSDIANKLSIQKPSNITEGIGVSISCSVEHTCPSSPPTLRWNKVGYNITERQVSLKDGVWKTETVIEYLPSYQDHGTTLECKATYKNGLESQRLATLHIIHKAKNVTIKGKDEIQEGAVLELQCHFSDNNPPTTNYSYSWFLYENPVNGETGRILRINNITKSHSGNYSCSVQNRAGYSYSPWFCVTVVSAQKREELPLRSILGGVAGAVMVILLVLALYLFLRTSKKSQKLEAPGGGKVETKNQGQIPSDGSENYYCNVSASADSSRNGTTGTQLSEMELEDLYSKPKEPNEVDYVLVDHAASKKAPQMQNRTEETEYSVVTC